MKKHMITMGLTLLISSNVVANEALTEQDLMNHYVAELESEVGQLVDLYDVDAVFTAARNHQQYLLLCGNKLATEKCDQAKQDLSKLENALTVHMKFQDDLAAMWDVKNRLKKTDK